MHRLQAGDCIHQICVRRIFSGVICQIVKLECDTGVICQIVKLESDTIAKLESDTACRRQDAYIRMIAKDILRALNATDLKPLTGALTEEA